MRELKVAVPDWIETCSEKGGPIPQSGVSKGSFWAGYRGIGGPNRGVAGSLQRRAYEAGQRRAKAEPGLQSPGGDWP